MGAGLLAIAFASLVAADHTGYIAWLDDEYRANGFCVAEHSTHGFNSYEMCFFIDAVVATFLLLSERARPIRAHAPPILLHGCLHYLQYLFGWPLPRALHISAYAVFAVSLMYEFGVGLEVGSKRTLALSTAAVVGIESLLVPAYMQFAYTNLWVFVVAASTDIARTRKGPEYLDPYCRSWPATIMLFWAGGVFPFLEAAACNSGVKALGGHAIFDTSIAAIALITMATMESPAAKGKSA